MIMTFPNNACYLKFRCKRPPRSWQNSNGVNGEEIVNDFKEHSILRKRTDGDSRRITNNVQFDKQVFNVAGLNTGINIHQNHIPSVSYRNNIIT